MKLSKKLNIFIAIFCTNDVGQGLYIFNFYHFEIIVELDEHHVIKW